MKRLIACCTLLVALSSVSLAQDAAAPQGFLMFHQNKVAGLDVPRLNQLADSIMRPVLDAMVEEQIIMSWGILTHEWGDEWNWNWYLTTADHASFVSAWAEFSKRIMERFPDGVPEMMQYLQAHKDNQFLVRKAFGRPLAAGEAPPRFMMSNLAMVKEVDVPAIDKLFDTAMAPALNAMLAEGLIYGWGDLRHAWGDEWNIGWYISTKDHAAFVTAWESLLARVMKDHPEALMEAQKYALAHKDNLYHIQYAR
ncbi:MAG: hypothetical protein R2834_06540 [Rhodothermales bacterium]